MNMRLNTRMTDHGFTLIEVLLTMALSLVVLGGIYAVYTTQQKSYMVQHQVVTMQQNVRAAMFIMSREIRMAGYDPTHIGGGALIPPAGIATANIGELQFVADLNSDGDTVDGPDNDTNEQIRYHLTNDADDDGVADGSPCDLGREIWGGGLQVLAENVDALRFIYLDQNRIRLDDDGNGNVVASIPDISTVMLALVARTGWGDPLFTNSSVYQITLPDTTTEDVFTGPGDSFRRKLLTTEIRCRNL